MTQTENKVIQCRRDTAANWASNNPVPKAGEWCFETDTGITKIGDGVTAYNSLVPFRQTTATKTELDKLHGLSTTSTELGYVHGVTSEIQTQMNAKFAKADIQTSFGSTLSDEKVASEKLVKNNLDAKQDGITVANNSMLKASVLSAMNIVGENNSGRRYDEPKTLAKMISAAHSTFDSSKFTVEGTLNINNGIVSGFGTNNDIYLTTPFTDFSTLRVDIKTSRLGDYSSGALLIGRKINPVSPITVANVFNISKISLTKIRFFWRDGANNQIFTNDYTINSDTTLLSFEFKNNKVYLYEDGVLSDDSVTCTISSLYKEFERIYIGSGYAGEGAWSGTIDLKYINITVDGVPVFSGNKTSIDTIKSDDYTAVGAPTISADGVVTGFEAQKYISCSLTSSTTSNVRIKLPSFTIDSNVTTMQIVITGSLTQQIMAYTENSTGKFNIWLGNRDGSWTWTLNDVLNGAVTTNTIYNIELEISGNVAKIYNNGSLVKTQNLTSFSWNVPSTINIGSRYSWNTGSPAPLLGSIDLNSFKIYVDGNLVYQPCLKIPYTLAANDKKFIAPVYEDKAKDMAEQFGVAPYHILDETNNNFAFPYGSVEEKVAPKIVVGHYESGASAWEQYLDRTMIQRGTMVADTDVTFPCSDDYAETNFTLSCPFSAKTTSGFTPTASGTYIAVGKF